MKYIHLIATIFLAAVICIEFAYGINCYQCNSYNQQNCQDPFDNSTYKPKPCKADYGLCRKIVQEIKVENKWEVRYIRQCAKNGYIDTEQKEKCKDRVGTTGVKMRYCHCNDDGCNTASNWNLPIGLITATLAAQYFWHKL